MDGGGEVNKSLMDFLQQAIKSSGVNILCKNTGWILSHFITEMSMNFIKIIFLIKINLLLLMTI